MSQNDSRTFKVSRRTILKGSAAVAGVALAPGAISLGQAQAQDRANTMVVAAPATPQSLDSEYDVSLGTFEAIACLYDSLVEFEKKPDAGVPTASREDITDYPDKPGRVNMVGKLAESWEIDPDGTWARFHLRPIVSGGRGERLRNSR